jgi:hypothetical protein
MEAIKDVPAEHPRAVIPGQFVRLTSEPARVAIPGHQPPDEPRVELIKQGDVIQAIDLTCPCGRKIRLRCVYP